MSILRTRLIRLAHARPDLRPHLLPLVTDRVAMEHATQEALEKYLKEHPGADKSKHTVKKQEKATGSKATVDKYLNMKAWDHRDHKGRADGDFDPGVRKELGKMLEVFADLYGPDNANDAAGMEYAYSALKSLRTLMHADGEEAAGEHDRRSMKRLWADAVDDARIPAKYRYDILDQGGD